jgi:hypothetical protein
MFRSLKMALLAACALPVISLYSCRKTDASSLTIDNSFFDKTIVVDGNKLVSSSTAFVNPVSKEINEEWIDKAIMELKKLEAKDHYVNRMKESAGQPVWNESLAFIGGDGAQTIITPLYNKSLQVNGTIFNTFRKDGKFRTQILSNQFARKRLREFNSSINSVGRATYNYLINYFETGKTEPILQANTNTVSDMEFFYTVCNYVPVLVYPPSTVVFQKQCHKEVYFGDYQAWDYYYNQNYNFIEEEEGYYEDYDQEEIDKAVENIWEREKIDTIDIAGNPCLTNVIRRLMANPTTDWGKIVSNLFSSSFGYNSFNAYPNFHVKFAVASSLPNNRAAETECKPSGLSIITINASVFDHCTDLYAASVLIHEFSHAYMGSMMWAHYYSDSTTISDFNGCFSAYGNWVYDETLSLTFDDNTTQHEYMAGFMVNGMAAALKEFDGGTQSDEFYWKMAWGSLSDTPTWNYYTNHPMTSESQKNGIWYTWPYALTASRMADIDAIIYAEQESTVDKKGGLHNFSNCY